MIMGLYNRDLVNIDKYAQLLVDYPPSATPSSYTMRCTMCFNMNLECQRAPHSFSLPIGILMLFLAGPSQVIGTAVKYLALLTSCTYVIRPSVGPFTSSMLWRSTFVTRASIG